MHTECAELRRSAIADRYGQRIWDALNVTLDELERAIKKRPSWPQDKIYAAAIVAGEAGELTRAALRELYERDAVETSSARHGAIQTAAMAIRFILEST